MTVMILDLETETTGNPKDPVSNPWNQELYIVAAGWCVEDAYGNGTIEGRYFDGPTDDEWLTIPDEVDMLVGHNLQYDVKWLLHRQPKAMWGFLHRGGRLFDTQTAEFILGGMTELYPGLNTTAPRYGGTAKVDVVKALWNQSVKTSQIEKRILFDEYLLGPSGDIENTRKVFWGQVQALQAKGMWDMFMLRMGGYLYNTLATYNGMHIDMTLAAEHRAEREAEYEELDKFVHESLKTLAPDLPGLDFKVTISTKPALLYGGYYKARYRGSYDPPKYVKADMYKGADGQYYPADGPVPEGAVTWARGVNKGAPKVFRVDTDEEKLRWLEAEYELPGIIPWDHLTDAFRERLENYETTMTHADGSKVYPTGREFVEAWAEQPSMPEEWKPVAKAMVRLSELDKELGTYYMRTNGQGEQVGMLTYVDPYDNVVHHELNTTSVKTGRLSGTKPNLTNVPRGDTARVKLLFTSRFNDRLWLDKHRHEIGDEVYQYCLEGLEVGEPRGRMIEIDYSALEVVVLAAFSKDKNLMDALIKGTDMHCMRLASSLGEPYEDVLRKCKDEHDPQHAEYKKMRTLIKPKAFQFQYGGTAYGMAFNLGCTVEEAQEFIDNERRLFPGVERWYEKKVYPEIEATAHTVKLAYDDGERAVFRGTWTSPGGTVYTFEKRPKDVWINGAKTVQMQFHTPHMRNFPIQGEGSFFVQAMAGEVIWAILARKKWRNLVYAVNQVHDALYFDTLDRLVTPVVKVVKPIMESIPDFMADYGYQLPVPFPTEAEAGANLFEKHHVTL